jgi:mannan endo-1,4-beta-mannosidase
MPRPRRARCSSYILHPSPARPTSPASTIIPTTGSRYTDLAYDLTGKYPGLFGAGLRLLRRRRQGLRARPPRHDRRGRAPVPQRRRHRLTWHEVRPTDDEPVTFRDSVQGHLTDYEWQQVLTPGTPLYNRWCAQVDVVAGYLRQLRDAHVPVLFRAYHEMNGNWFWWGGRPGKDGSAALYRQIYDRFVNVHHLDNLVWVWNVNAPSGNAGSIAEYYPGAQFADVVTMDIYGEFKQDYYDSMLALAAGKPIALAEVGAVPSPDVLEPAAPLGILHGWSELVRASKHSGPAASHLRLSARAQSRRSAPGRTHGGHSQSNRGPHRETSPMLIRCNSRRIGRSSRAAGTPACRARSGRAQRTVQ